ncbi:hypothetical protein PROPEN_00974 [Proteus penneri ATCC 35198]|nr:hypothetical protein PROPEN_00974 [Proteus penneri ATCC 35198]
MSQDVAIFIGLLSLLLRSYLTFTEELNVLNKSLRFTFLLGALGIMGTFSTQALAQKPTLTVYTYDSFTADWGPGPAIKKKSV